MNRSRSTTPSSNERTEHDSSTNNDRRLNRLAPGITLQHQLRSVSPPNTGIHQAPNPVNESTQNASNKAPSYLDSSTMTNFIDEIKLEKIMATMEKQDHLLFQSMARGISVSQYKHELMLRLCE